MFINQIIHFVNAVSTLSSAPMLSSMMQWWYQESCLQNQCVWSVFVLSTAIEPMLHGMMQQLCLFFFLCFDSLICNHPIVLRKRVRGEGEGGRERGDMYPTTLGHMSSALWGGLRPNYGYLIHISAQHTPAFKLVRYCQWASPCISASAKCFAKTSGGPKKAWHSPWNQRSVLEMFMLWASGPKLDASGPNY